MEDKNTENLGTQRLSMRRYLNEFVGLCILLTCSIQMVPDHREFDPETKMGPEHGMAEKMEKNPDTCSNAKPTTPVGKKSKYIRLQHFVFNVSTKKHI